MEEINQPLVDNDYLLEKFPGKGGWTYTTVPEIPPDKKAWFNWVKVRGSIDGYEIKSYHLMPMGNGLLFLPVKAEIRKKIRKEAGDTVHVILFADNSALEIPENLRLCLEDEPEARRFFEQLSEYEQSAYIKWITSAKREETQIERLAKTINRLVLRLKFGEKGE